MKRFNLKYFLIIFFIIFVTGCAPQLQLKKDVSINELGICVAYGEETEKPTIKLMDLRLKEFTTEFNKEHHMFNIVQCYDSNNKLHIEVLKTKLVGPGKQVAGCLISTLGLITPFAMAAADLPVYVYFWYIPKNTTKAKLSLSKNISTNSKDIIVKDFTSFPYFGSLETQRKKHSKAFKEFVREAVIEIEKSID